MPRGGLRASQGSTSIGPAALRAQARRGTLRRVRGVGGGGGGGGGGGVWRHEHEAATGEQAADRHEHAAPLLAQLLGQMLGVPRVGGEQGGLKIAQLGLRGAHLRLELVRRLS